MRAGIFFILLLFLGPSCFADSNLSISVKLKPAGSFKVVANKIKGFATKNSEGVSAENVLVDLRSLSSGISLRDKHVKERLEVEKYPIAKLLKASGQGGSGTAQIEIKGQKQEISGTYKIKGATLVAQFKMKMSSLGITNVRHMGIGAADEVIVTIQLPVKGS